MSASYAASNRPANVGPRRAVSGRYAEALKRCSAVAREEFAAAQDAFGASRERSTLLSRQLEQAANAIRRDGHEFQKSRDSLEALRSRLEETISGRLDGAELHLGRLKRRLGQFTVALFGRTMAGKSTIREALTQGDGSTIGKGAQNTTRGLHEYDWNHLRILDAPGIASSDERVRAQLDSLARSAFEEADLVLFLLSSDGIQETVFEGLRGIRDMAKPVLFLLNYKLDLTKDVLRRRFLREGGLRSSRVQAEIAGHEKRLRSFACEHLGMREADVTVVPIHAQAAFLGRMCGSEEEQALYAASNVDSVMERLTSEILRAGVVRRMQTIVDGTSYDLGAVRDLLTQESRELAKQAKFVGGKFRELGVWCDGFVAEGNKGLPGELKAALAPLRASIAAFVEDNLERRDVKACWKRHVEAHGLGEWMQAWQKQKEDALAARMHEFARQIQAEASLLDSSALLAGIEQYDPIDLKRGFGWMGAGAGLGTGVLGLGVLLNWWNPAGWVMGALFGISVIAGLFGWFSDSREEKMARQRAKAATALRESVGELEAGILKQLQKWFEKRLVAVANDIVGEGRVLTEGMQSMAGLLRRAATAIDEDVSGLDRRLLLRAAQALDIPLAEGDLERVARAPGLRAKLLVRRPLPSRFGTVVGKTLGEWLDPVVHGPERQVVAAALRPAQVDARAVSIDAETARVTLRRDQVGKAIGRQGINVRLAGKLLQKQIKLIPEER
mgnify:CR=1 FL=1